MLKKYLTEFSFKPPPSFIEWSPFFLSMGIGCYFLHEGPPTGWEICTAITITLLMGVGMLWKQNLRFSFLFKALLLMLLGLLTVEGHRILKNRPKNPSAAHLPG